MRHICFLLLFWVIPVYAADAEPPIRFGLTAVVVTENLRFLDQWSKYLEERAALEDYLPQTEPPPPANPTESAPAEEVPEQAPSQ